VGSSLDRAFVARKCLTRMQSHEREEGEHYGNQVLTVAHHFVECLGMWKACNASNGVGCVF
jgi:hypothetical protein